MKKTFNIIIAILLVTFFAVSYLSTEKENTFSKENESSAPTEKETNLSSVSNNVLSISERNEKLIEACKSTPGTLNADVYKDILTIQVTSVEPEEAQKIAEGIFNEVKKYKENEHIKTVMVCDINYKLLGYAGAKK